MRDHFEGTPLDLSLGIGAGPYRLPYRWRPLTWKVDGITHLNERATSTQQTGFSFVTQARSWLPGPIGGVLWFSVDDSASTVYIPIYCGIRRVPRSYAEKTASFDKFSWDSAFWVFNFVANLAYARYSDKIKVIRRVQQQLEDRFFADQTRVERAALRLHRRSPEAARRYLTRYSVKTGEMTTARWRKLGEELMVKFLDGNVRDDKGKVTHPGYPEAWYRRIVEESRGHFRVRRIAGEPEPEGKKGKKKSARKKGKRGTKGEWWNLGAPCPCRRSRP
jgi:dipeptidase